MREKWLVVYASLSTKKAVDIVFDELKRYDYLDVQPCPFDDLSEEDVSSNNLIILGINGDNRLIEGLFDKKALKKPLKKEGYSISVSESLWNKDKKTAVICGYDRNGLLYGAVDFINLYMRNECLVGRRRYEDPSLYKIPLSKDTPDFVRISSPSVKKRGIWTWGHCIYDYKKFFENMLFAKLNEVVIWVDFVPKNALDIVNYAHECGVKLVWGYSWGWENKSAVVTDFSSKEVLDEWKEKLYKKYEEEFKDTNADGIYFQTFTERTVSSIGGNNVAKLAAKWVNGISEEFYKKYPNISLQFGLHATSVKDDTEQLKAVDKRMEIVWEDCGSMPFSYMPNDVENFDETLSFAEKVLSLRGKGEKCGFVFKGFSVLDWSKFNHIKGRITIGEKSEEFIAERTEYKRKQWRVVQSVWLKNYSLAKKTVERLLLKRNDFGVLMLVEDGMLESGLWFPLTLVSEILWDSSANACEILGRVSLSAKTLFANN